MTASLSIRLLVVLFLLLQGVGTLVWWALLLVFPTARGPFLASDTSDAALLAFLLPDLTVYAGGSLVAGYGLARHRRWAWSALCVNAGAGVYAALYVLAIAVLTGRAWLGAALMAPSLIVLPVAVWMLRREALC